jgi:hypothetical protein
MQTIGITAPPAASGPAAQTIFELGTAYMISAALHVALRLDVADHLAKGPMPVDALASATGANADRLYRVLRALSSVGIFEEQPSRRFASNAAADLLRSEPGSLRDIALFMTNRLHFQIYAEMLHSVKTGQPAVEQATGQPLFELFARDSEDARLFNDAMTSMSAAVMPAILNAYDFGDIGLLVDVAGGHGHVLGSILREYPAMHGVLFDLDHVIAGAHGHLRRIGVTDRCQTVSGNFFTAVPAGGDAYVMKHILHDWDDDQALAILANIRNALGRRPDGRVLLFEMVIPDGSEADLGKLVDLEMMVMPGGRERTADEFDTLFARAGFELTQIVATESPMSVIEARVTPA